MGGDNLGEHPIALMAMPVFLLGMGACGLPETVAMVSSIPSIGGALAPFLVASLAFAAQGVFVAGLITASIKTMPRIE